MNLRLLCIFLFTPLMLLAQEETLTIMQYNLTYYGNTGGAFIGCDNTNNDPNDKNTYLTTIVNAVLPDVFGVNEVGNNINYVNSIRDNVLNTNGRTYYKNAVMNGSGDIINMLYYNSDKLELQSEDIILRNLDGSFITRQIDVHTLYYKDPDLATGADTIFLTFIVAHLKAGSATDDIAEREAAAEAVMNYVEHTGTKGYRFLMGDFNSRSSSEGAIQHFTNWSTPNFSFVDPVDQLGDWQSASYANIHTQSTRDNNSNGGCFATGGLDDRFDMILVAPKVMHENAKAKYIDGTYQAYGQDGSAYNGDLPISGNGAVSSTVAQALYNMSDHLPVVMDIGLYPSNSGVTGSMELSDGSLAIHYTNPTQGALQVTFTDQSITKVLLEVVSLNGQTVFSTQVSTSQWVDIASLPAGVYVLRCTAPDRQLFAGKLVKTR